MQIFVHFITLSVSTSSCCPRPNTSSTSTLHTTATQQLQTAGATQTMARIHLFAPVLLLLVPNHSSAQCSQTTNYRAPSAGRW